MSAADQQALDQLLLERLCAKRRRDFDTADKLRDRLREAGVTVDDHAKTYSVVGRDAAMAAGPGAAGPGARGAGGGRVRV